MSGDSVADAEKGALALDLVQGLLGALVSKGILDRDALFGAVGLARINSDDDRADIRRLLGSIEAWALGNGARSDTPEGSAPDDDVPY